MNGDSVRFVLRCSFATLLVAAVGCQRAVNENSINGNNVVRAGDGDVHRTIGDSERTFGVVATGSLWSNPNVRRVGSLQAKRLLDPIARSIASTRGTSVPTSSEGEAGPSSLILGFPISLLPENQIFGGVVTALSDANSETLGRLKLTDLTPIHVKPLVVKVTEESYVMALMGCLQNCGEASPQMPLISIPIVAVDIEKKQLLLDLAPLGKELNLIEMMDPLGDYTKLKTKTSTVSLFDYSLSTLVFDVQVKMVPVDSLDPAAPETMFTVRWYMKLGSFFNPAFESRVATPGVGFFMTERSASPRIQRFSRRILAGVSGDAGPVHYYIKNVPMEHQPAFASAFDGWNANFKGAGGTNLLTYEFVSADDPRNALLVTGDIRYNILEWDLVNQAPYGGLGPSIANQFTGEILSANVLVQGPTIIKLYKKWFEVTRQGAELRSAGRNIEADALLRRTFVEIDRLQRKGVPVSRFDLSLGENLTFRVPAQMPQYEDPLFARDDFEIIPEGMTFEAYMKGYFHELVAHEMGHNVGLRHNFRGNLSSDDSGAVGSVSHSVMEYLGRGFRHLADIGRYDVMAIRYGYQGALPDVQNLFCTDEDVSGASNLNGSAECSRDDATRDPFGFFEMRLGRSIDLVIARGSTVAPTWTVADLKSQLGVAITGLTLYAATAEKTGATWTNFFTGGDRPTSVAEVKGYVVRKMRDKLCDPTIASVIEAKQTAEAKEKTLLNLKALGESVAATIEPLGGIAALDLQCR